LHAFFDVLYYGDNTPWEAPGDWQEIGQRLIRDVMNKHAGSYVMYLEDSLDWALGGSTSGPMPQIGNHGKFCRFCVGFLDGHAEYKFMDMRGWCGVGWAAINPEWVRRPGQTKPIYYTPPDKNCDPP